MYAGEVVRETPEGGQVFSDTIKVPGTNRTFADYAKKLTDMKGKKKLKLFNLLMELHYLCLHQIRVKLTNYKLEQMFVILKSQFIE